MGALWHPFADNAAIDIAGELVLTRGEGAYVWDDAGNRYLDSTASLWYCNVGYGRAEIADAVARQLRDLPAYSTFGDTVTRPLVDLADRLAEMAPLPGMKMFFSSGGSDAVDTATKLVRRYWQEMGQPQRTAIIVRRHAYHGMHVGGTALGGIDANRAGYGDAELLDDVIRIEWDTPEALAQAIDAAAPERVAAFFCEPVVGAGGVFPPPPGYLDAVRQICRDTGVLFVADEVITGFGRIGGSWFASNRFDLQPDLVLGAKGLTSGYVPMGVVLISANVAEPLWQPGVVWRHGYTYSGHAGAAAAAMANLDIIEREDLLERALDLEAILARDLASLADHELVSEVRSGTGALAAVQLSPEALAADPALGGKTVMGLRRHGVLSRALAIGALQVSPSFVFDTDDVKALREAILVTLDERAAELA